MLGLVVVGLGVRHVVQERDEARRRDQAAEARDAAAQSREARQAYATALRTRDLDTVRAGLDDPTLITPAQDVVVGRDVEVMLDGGYAVLTAALEGGAAYGVVADAALDTVVVDAGGEPTPLIGVVAPTIGGRYTFLVAAHEPTTTAVTLRLVPVELDILAVGRPAPGLTLGAGATRDFVLPGLEADQRYIIAIDAEDVTAGVLAPDGADVATTADVGNDGVRFATEDAGTYRVRVTTPTTVTFTIEVWQLAEFNWYFGTPGDTDRLPPASDLAFSEWRDDGRRGLQACVFLRADVGLHLTLSALDASGAPAVAILDVADDDGSGRILAGRQLRTRQRAATPGAEVDWSTRLDRDRNLCLRAWVEGDPPGWTASATWELES